MHASPSSAALAASLIRQAGAAGRETLNQAELGSLLSALGIAFGPPAATPPAPAAFDFEELFVAERDVLG